MQQDTFLISLHHETYTNMQHAFHVVNSLLKGIPISVWVN